MRGRVRPMQRDDLVRAQTLPVIASEAKQSRGREGRLDCFRLRFRASADAVVASAFARRRASADKRAPRNDGVGTIPDKQRRHRVVCIILLYILLLPAPASAGSALPNGFVYLRDVEPGIVQDIRYAGSHNFVGRPINGYLAAECILTAPAAMALAAIQKTLAAKNLSLIVWDCYRPMRAVADFLRWSKDPARAEMKAAFYPRIDKRNLFV